MTVSSSSSMLGFNGVPHEVHAPWQFLGNGYRVYNPVLMRFHSPDSLSPFGRGGLNPYAYCIGDPLNRIDPDGHWSFNFLANLVGFRLKQTLMTPVYLGTSATLVTAGVAVVTEDETQRRLVIAAAIVVGVGTLLAARHAYAKRILFPTPVKSAASPVTAPAPAPAPVSTPATASTSIASVSPAPSRRMTWPLSKPSRPVRRGPAPYLDLRRAQVRLPAPSKRLQMKKVNVGTIRRGSVEWDETVAIPPLDVWG